MGVGIRMIKTLFKGACDIVKCAIEFESSMNKLAKVSNNKHLSDSPKLVKELRKLAERLPFTYPQLRQEYMDIKECARITFLECFIEQLGKEQGDDHTDSEIIARDIVNNECMIGGFIKELESTKRYEQKLHNDTEVEVDDDGRVCIAFPHPPTLKHRINNG